MGHKGFLKEVEPVPQIFYSRNLVKNIFEIVHVI